MFFDQDWLFPGRVLYIGTVGLGEYFRSGKMKAAIVILVATVAVCWVSKGIGWVFRGDECFLVDF